MASFFRLKKSTTPSTYLELRQKRVTHAVTCKFELPEYEKRYPKRAAQALFRLHPVPLCRRNTTRMPKPFFYT